MVNRQMAMEWLIHCITAAEADGYQQAEGEKWTECLGAWCHDEREIEVQIGADTFTFTLSKKRKGYGQ